MPKISNKPWDHSFDSNLSWKGNTIKGSDKKIRVMWPWTILDSRGECIARCEKPQDAEYIVKAVKALEVLESIIEILNLAHKTYIE